VTWGVGGGVTGDLARGAICFRATDRHDACFELPPRSGVQPEAEGSALGPAQAEKRSMTVFVYVNTAKQVGDPDHIKVFAKRDAAEKWFEENDPEGVALEYEVLE
jgi:hypothetical protein